MTMAADLVRQRVLLVDDEPQVLVALEDLLSDDFVVLKTDSPERALHLVEQEHDIAVVVTDQRMPKMTGDELLSRLGGYSDATRILVTGFADLSAVIRAVNDGKIYAYVTKPWNPEEFRLTVHKAAEHFRLAKELANERQLLHDLVENIPDGIYFKDRDLRFLKVNRPFSDLLMLDHPDGLLGKRMSEVAAPSNDAATDEARERRMLDDGQPTFDVVREVGHNGSRTWLSETKAPVRSAHGEILGLVGVSRDVTERVKIEQALRTSEERLRLTFRGSAAGLFDWNLVTGHVSYSPTFESLLGQAEGQLSPTLQELESRIFRDDSPIFKQALRDHLELRKPFNHVEFRAHVRSGDYQWFLASGQAVWDDDGKATRLVGSITDIGDRKRQEERIHRMTRIHAVRSGINAAIVRIRDRGELLAESCRIAVQVGDLALALAVGNDAANGTVHLLAAEPGNDAIVDALTPLLDGKALPSGAAFERAIATKQPIIVNDVFGANLPSSTPFLRHGHRALASFPLFVAGEVIGVFALTSRQQDFFDAEEVRLLTELADNLSFALDHIAKTERLKFLTSYDEVTTLPNRGLLLDRLSQQVAACRSGGQKLAIVLVDVGRFRHVNDMLGWQGGDALLVQIAGRLQSMLQGRGATGTRDTLARFDSNAFAALLAPVGDESDVATFVENQILGCFKESFTVGGTELRISVKVGIASFPSDGQEPAALIANAEAALKKAKASGQTYLFYAPSMNARVAEKLTLETRLRHAVEREEFVLHYQPKVDLKSGAIVGLEALIRWLDPETGLVPPGRFIPVLEETGLILDVGRWVLGRAAAQYNEWVAEGRKPPRIAVNVSAIQLAQTDFTSSVERVVARYSGAESGLDLEITESVFVEDLLGNSDKLSAVRRFGLQVSIDDFGTGYSSLGYLNRLPIDALKIDRSFVIKMAQDPQDMALVTTIIQLAHALDLKVIAEGVETTQHAHLLRLLKCDQLQGYLVAKPQPADVVVKLLGTTVDLSVARA